LAGEIVVQGMEGPGERGATLGTTDVARIECPVAVTLMDYLVLLRMQAQEIRAGQPWSAFALKHHFACQVSAQHFRRCA
jgi:hypothetical protein